MTWPSLERPKAKLNLHCRSISDLEMWASSRVHRCVGTEVEWRCQFMPRLTASPNYTPFLMSKEKPALARAAHWTADETQTGLACTSCVSSRSFQPTDSDRLRFSWVDASCKVPGYISVPLHKPWQMLECHFTPVRNGNPAVFNFSMYI